MIEHQTKMGQILRESLKSSEWRIVDSAPLPLVCFTREGLDTTQFLATLRDRQSVWMSEAKLGGISVLLACITSFKTTEADIRWVVNEMNRLVDENAAQYTSMQEVVASAQARNE
jgi:hypothetical protein